VRAAGIPSSFRLLLTPRRLQQEEERRAAQASADAERALALSTAGRGGGGGWGEEERFGAGRWGAPRYARAGDDGGRGGRHSRDWRGGGGWEDWRGGGGGGRGGGGGGGLAAAAAAGGAALPMALAMANRDFGPDDYETLQALDERVVKRGASAAELAASTAVCAAAPRAKGGAAAGGAGAEDATCAVCLEEPAAGEMVRRLRCMHVFHVACIDRWLEASRLCPVCKMTVGEGN